MQMHAACHRTAPVRPPHASTLVLSYLSIRYGYDARSRAETTIPELRLKGYFACAHRNGSNACSSHVYRAAAAVQQLLRSLPTSNHVNVMIPVDNIIQRFINFSPFHLTTLSDVRPRHMRLRTNVSCRRLYCSDRRITAVLRLTLACVCEQPIGAFQQNCFPAISIAALFAPTLFLAVVLTL